MADDARPVERAAVGDGGDDARHLQRRRCDFLSDADIRRAAERKRNARVLRQGDIARGGFLSG